MTGSCLIFYVAILVASISTTQALAQETEVIAGGDLEYQNHCAICHGVDGKGRGVMNKFLTIQPADLTQVSKKNADRFPFWQVYRVIDGREEIRGHVTKQLAFQKILRNRTAIDRQKDIIFSRTIGMCSLCAN